MTLSDEVITHDELSLFAVEVLMCRAMSALACGWRQWRRANT